MAEGKIIDAIEIRKGMYETVPWTFQIVDIVFVSHVSTYSLYFECGYLDLTLQGPF
jgi:hypothetical protein